jgi:hypothetical protein
MQASATAHPDPDQLLAVGDGDGATDVVAHVRGCALCARQVAEDSATQAALRHALYRVDCPAAQTLGEYRLELLDPEARTRVAAHAAGCEECHADLEVLRGYLGGPVDEPSPSFVERARRVIASLFKPPPDLAYGGLRGSAPDSGARVFVADDITVTVGRGGEPSTLIGLVIVPSVPADALVGQEVRLVPTDAAPLTSKIDDLGNFEFARVPVGRYALELDLLDTLIVIEELTVD